MAARMCFLNFGINFFSLLINSLMNSVSKRPKYFRRKPHTEQIATVLGSLEPEEQPESSL